MTVEVQNKILQYHENNPKAKQTEIGAIFGYERRLLRKRSKGKFPKILTKCSLSSRIEKELWNWAHKQQQKGFSVTDDALQKKAQFFLSSIDPDPDPESHREINGYTWFENNLYTRLSDKSSPHSCNYRRKQ
ncbi:MAG: hypothetical protein M1834_004257 [Cirrosporium novae-zelandiae]|nr:MAG: hypothetical protein M1834_004257 [Cirrosporium novae-zelandiae]